MTASVKLPRFSLSLLLEKNLRLPSTARKNSFRLEMFSPPALQSNLSIPVQLFKLAYFHYLQPLFFCAFQIIFEKTRGHNRIRRQLQPISHRPTGRCVTCWHDPEQSVAACFLHRNRKARHLRLPQQLTHRHRHCCHQDLKGPPLGAVQDPARSYFEFDEVAWLQPNASQRGKMREVDPRNGGWAGKA